MKARRILSSMMALLLVCSLPLAAFADTWYLEDGDITVSASADESGVTTQTVTQGSTIKDDDAPTITQRNIETSPSSTITITAEEGAEANVTIENVNIDINDPSDHSGEAVVTITAEENATANVTLSGVNIDVGETGSGGGGDICGEAAIQITGDGDVTIELDGENTVQSGALRAGVEKNTACDPETGAAGETGEFTITDENETHGSLNATGGKLGAGIGGGTYGSSGNITITGSAEVTAQGGLGAAGIGGGDHGSGSGIAISDSAQVEATGGLHGAGIGGGNEGVGFEIAVSDNAQVKAQGGNGRYFEAANCSYGAGAAIGDGGHHKEHSSDLDSAKGKDAVVTTDAPQDGESYGLYVGELNEGWVATYAPGEDMDKENPGSLTYQGGIKMPGATPVPKQEPTCTEPGHEAGYEIDGVLVAVTIPAKGHSFTDYVSDNNATYTEDGTKTAHCDHPGCTETHTIPDPGTRLPFYQVKGEDGARLPCREEKQDGVLTITVDEAYATLTGRLSGIQALKAQGIDTIVFVTSGAASTFAIEDLLAQGSLTESFSLTHDGSAVTFTLGQDTDLSKILK